MSKDIKKITKIQGWSYSTDSPTNEHLTLSCLMRIADATDAMAKNYVRLLEDVRWYKEQRDSLLRENRHLKGSVAGHKAAYTKLKNQLKNGQK